MTLRVGSPALHFLGLDVENGRPFYPQEPIPEDPAVRHRPLRPGLASDRLEETGWGVLFPLSIDPAIREALAPLLDLRREQAGPRYRELTYVPREGPGYFLSRLRAGPGPVVPSSVPYYLLLVGDPTQIPHGFHLDLALQYAVGRLCLDSVEAYASYARSVVEAERSNPKRDTALELFSMGHAKDQATDVAREFLVTPLVHHLRDRFEGMPIRWIDGAEASKAALKETITTGQSSITFTVGHAALFSPNSPRLRPCQGALVCSDWPGQGPATSKQYFCGMDLPEDADLAGRLFVFFGCHTAGTPKLDSFGPPGKNQRKKRRRLASKPFMAHLPQALLGHRRGGALAVIAHIDRAFPRHSFGSFSDGQFRVFEDVLYQLLRGQPVGLAMESFALRHAELASRLVSQALEVGDGDFETLSSAELWTAYADTRSHIILGDPAVRLTDQGLPVSPR